MIRAATPEDLSAIVDLAAARRAEYAGYQPRFWRPAHDASHRHRRFLANLIADESWGCLVAEDGGVAGYLFARLVAPPPVYEPGGPSCFIDDFSVRAPQLWPTIGAALLEAGRSWGRRRGASQLVVVNAHRDKPMGDLLHLSGMSIASSWWTCAIDE